MFLNKHILDRYSSFEIEYKRFDSNLQQALAWNHLKSGTFVSEDIEWLKHECAERHHELKYNKGPLQDGCHYTPCIQTYRKVKAMVNKQTKIDV